MGSLWLKIKVWTKSTLLVLALLYLALFVYNNSGQSKNVTFWYWFNHEYNGQLLFLLAITFLLGGLTYFLVRTVFSTIGQMRELRNRRQQREAAEMVKKAAMLKADPAHASGAMDVPPPPTTTG
jgi:hypothetical protein